MATVVLIEKVTRTATIPRILGVSLIVWGAFVLTGLASYDRCEFALSWKFGEGYFGTVETATAAGLRAQTDC